MDKLADIAIASGADFNGFKASLQGSNLIKFDGTKVIHLKGINKDIGDINSVKDKFGNIVTGTVSGSQDELDDILFGNEGEF